MELRQTTGTRQVRPRVAERRSHVDGLPQNWKSTMSRKSNKNGISEESRNLVVFDIVRDSECAECRKELLAHDFLFMEDGRPLCLACADLGHLAYLPRGD